MAAADGADSDELAAILASGYFKRAMTMPRSVREICHRRPRPSQFLFDSLCSTSARNRKAAGGLKVPKKIRGFRIRSKMLGIISDSRDF
jgi:hypothetical protein